MSTTDRSREWYNSNADAYAAHVRNPEDSIYHSYYEKPAIYAELPDLTGKTVLSLGCGSGEDSQHLKDLGAAESRGIDISEKLIEIAKRDHPGCEFSLMDMKKLDFEDGIFDLVYSSLAIHYIVGGPEPVFKEAFRVLKPGGMFLFSSGDPIESSMVRSQNPDGSTTKQLAIVRSPDEESESYIGDYMTPKIFSADNKGLGVDIWHQPVSHTINQLTDCGFMLDKLIHPLPTEEMKRVSSRHYERLMRIPEMMIVKAHKPA